jgi:hypothetical protein
MKGLPLADRRRPLRQAEVPTAKGAAVVSWQTEDFPNFPML